MSKAKHTPGPWEFQPGDYGYFTLVGAGNTEVLATSGQNDGDYPIVWMGEEMTDADKHLIEAAPDLYAACQSAEEELLIFDDRYGDIGSGLAVEQLRSALKKARGEYS